MKKKIYSALIGLLSLAAGAQTINKAVQPFSQLELNGAAKVEITSYDSTYCYVDAETNDAKNIVVTQQGDKLIITTTGLINNDYTIKVGAKGLKTVVVDGASSLQSEIIYHTENFSLQGQGAGKAKLMLETKKLDVTAGGGSSVRLKGYTEDLTIETKDNAKVKGVTFVAQTATVKSKDNSSVVVVAKQNLVANSSEAAKIYYGGKPTAKTLNKTHDSKIEEYTDDNNLNTFDKNWTFGKTKRNNYNGGFKHWTGIGLNFNGYTNADYQTTLSAQDDYMSLNFGKSIGWNLNLYEHDFHIWKNYINLCTGIGFEFNKYSFKNKITLNPDSSYVTATLNNSNNYTKNVLKTSYVDVPLILEINTSKNPNRAFHIGVGAIFGYKLGSRTKQYYDNNGYETSILKKDDYNLNPFKVQALAQVGYGRFTLYGSYALTTLFQDNQGPQLYPFTIGVRLIPFD